MSMMPEPRYWPRLAWNTKRGMPNRMERSKNCTMKTMPKSMVRIANLDMLNIPMVQVRQANMKLNE